MVNEVMLSVTQYVTYQIIILDTKAHLYIYIFIYLFCDKNCLEKFKNIGVI